MNDNAAGGTDATPRPTRAVTKRLGDCRTLQEAFETAELRDRIASAIPRHMSPDTLLRSFIQAASKTPLIYRCDLRQSLGAFLSLSYLGLAPGTSLNHAHLIPFRKGRLKPGQSEKDQQYDLQVIIGYHGLVELAFRSGFVKDIHTGVVFPGEHFEHENGTSKFMVHRRNVDLDTSNLTPRCAYAVAQMVNGGSEFEIMPWWEVLSIRNRSQAYRRALNAKNAAQEKGQRLPLTWTEAPWVRDTPRMGCKTALRRLSNLLPKCPELRAGVTLDEQSDHAQSLDFGPVIDGHITPEDGIPESGSADPGAAFGTRGGQEQPPDDDGYDGEEPADPPPVTRQERPPQQQQTRLAFTAYLVNQHGEVGHEFRDPGDFAAALAAIYEPASTQDRENIIEHNADAIDEARDASVRAAHILNGLSSIPPPPAEEQRQQQNRGAMFSQPVAIEVPQNNGKPVWSQWSRAVREELLLVSAADLRAWVEAQKDNLLIANQNSRFVVMRAMADAFERHGIKPLPDWLVLPQTKPADPPPSEAPWDRDAYADAHDAPPVESTPREPPRERTKDEQRGDGYIADLEAMPLDQSGRDAFDILVRLETTRTFMARLRRENVPLFDRIREAFEAKNVELPKSTRPAEAP